MELFVPAVADGHIEEDETLGSGPTWSDSESEEEAPPPKPRKITKTEKKRAQIEALLRVGTRVPVIMETLRVGANTVYRVNKLMREAHLENRETDLAVKLGPGAGRPLKRTPEFLRVLKETFTADPMLHYSFVASQLSVSKKTISRGVRDLGMRSYIRRHRALITKNGKVIRVERTEELLEYISAHPTTVIVFSDKKKITIDGQRNRQG